MIMTKIQEVYDTPFIKVFVKKVFIRDHGIRRTDQVVIGHG